MIRKERKKHPLFRMNIIQDELDMPDALAMALKGLFPPTKTRITMMTKTGKARWEELYQMKMLPGQLNNDWF